MTSTVLIILQLPTLPLLAGQGTYFPMTDQQPMPDLATHFDDPFLSDFQLRLVTPEDATLAQFHVHGIVLAGQSGYFKSLLQNWMGQDARVFNITISEDELTAAKHMLQCAYSNCMPKDAKAEQLLATMVLADRCELLQSAR